MPKLSFIGELMLLRSQLYGHVLKLGAGHGQYGLKGHLVSVEIELPYVYFMFYLSHKLFM